MRRRWRAFLAPTPPSGRLPLAGAVGRRAFAWTGAIMQWAFAWTVTGLSVIACGGSTSAESAEGRPALTEGGADGLGSPDAPDRGQDSSDAEPLDAACVPLAACSCAEASTCGTCVLALCGVSGAVCPVPGNGTCACGVVLQDNCSKPASHCLCPACGDGEGICVTAVRQTELCSSAFGPAFSCR
jgi:hypothetical protein